MVTVEEHDELPKATQIEDELQRQLDSLQNQVTELHKARERAAHLLEISLEDWTALAGLVRLDEWMQGNTLVSLPAAGRTDGWICAGPMLGLNRHLL
ncbi:hypothetical protein Bca52824_035344 [Brassica carinata]|uniref:Uncharacterized protein n=1 Tax=Brassica carinata TaxID=52824 RepID=A0A8X7S376_BRACI|nr:hypothetical protein Bca52824_035344 [Brassica carinata]